jgi:hypothetical protein
MTLRRRIEVALVLVAAVGAIAVAAHPGERAAALRPLLTATATGHLKMQNSRQGHALVRFHDAVPGEAGRSRVTLNDSGETGVVKAYLSVDRVTDVPGPKGRRLSRALRVSVVRLRWRGDRRRLKYRGALLGLKNERVGTWLRPGKPRTYAIRVLLPDHGAPPGPSGGDNAYQGAGVSFGLHWGVRPAGDRL